MTNPSSGPSRKVSPAVFRRRRLVVGLGLLAVIVAIVLIIVQPGGATPTPAATSGTSTTNPGGGSTAGSSPASTSAAGTSNAPACDPDDLTVGAVTDAVDYQAGVLPQLSLTITNNGTAPCVYNVGTSQQVLAITSGAETYWMSSDCQTDPADLEAVLEPGKTETSAPIQWSRERSAEGACDTAGAAVPANGASYYLTAKVGDVSSTESRQFLLY
jgi:hypothetical protein